MTQAVAFLGISRYYGLAEYAAIGCYEYQGTGSYTHF